LFFAPLVAQCAHVRFDIALFWAVERAWNGEVLFGEQG
jgi:hypothetical protein